MKLSLKQKALLFTIGALMASIIAGLSISQILAMIPAYMVPYIGIGFVVIVMAKLLYGLILNDLELRELNKKG